MTYSVPRTRLPIHGTTRYIRTELEVDDGVVRWDVPRTLLGMLEIGSRRIEVPIDDVASVEIRRFTPHPVRLLVGVAGVALPWFFLPWWASVPLLILGLWTIITTLGPHLELRTKAGEVHRTPVCPGHSLDADLYIAAVGDMISE
jgi:hypothetical protein